MRLLFVILFPFISFGQSMFSHEDTLRGSINKERSWWNVLKYDITIQPDYLTKTIKGKNTILFEVVRIDSSMQIDLQSPMKVDSIFLADLKLDYRTNGNVVLIDFTNHTLKEKFSYITIYFSGQPIEAKNAPWEGGWIWTKDGNGRPWMTVACQGLGASSWFPCKDHQSDEPENGSTLTMIISDTLVGVSNGKLVETKPFSDGLISTTWMVSNPINNYNIIPYIGKYVHFGELYKGEKGPLNCDYWVLDYELEKAKVQFLQVPKMLKCFEYWFGPYPFYSDGYKLVQAPYLGMEHQSGIAYGNKFENGYLGRDLSESNWGLKWDFILIHESGHEWFGNSITANDIADAWIHESFTNYSETIFTDCEFGVQAGNAYEVGLRKLIKNNSPIISQYGVNNNGNIDIYYKGSNMVHMVRQLVNDDERFRQLLRGINRKFYHKTVNTLEIEEYISSFTSIDFNLFFDQYLRKNNLPVLEYKIENNQLFYHWSECVKGFNMKLRLENGQWIQPTEDWRILDQSLNKIEDFKPDINFYIILRKL